MFYYGDSYIKFLIKYACNEVDVDFEEKETSAKVLTDEVCIVGELNDDDVQKRLIDEGCSNLFEFAIRNDGVEL